MQGKTGSNPAKQRKKLAATPGYLSPNQLRLPGFETPFDQQLDPGNRWVRLASVIPWDKIVGKYDNLFKSKEGRRPISGRVILGSVMIKHLGNLSDRETIAQIQENMYLQYFLGYSSFTTEAPFSHSLFVQIRERLSMDLLGEINEAIILNVIKEGWDEQSVEALQEKSAPTDVVAQEEETSTGFSDEKLNKNEGIDHSNPKNELPNKGKLLMDATVAPQNITFPTDLKLLNAARQKSEELIDKLYDASLHGSVKVRTYRQVARKDYLNAAKRKRKTSKLIYKANDRQIRYLRRNLDHINNLLNCYDTFPLTHREQKYLMVLHTVYEQQKEMHEESVHRIDHRIVNIHQPHVRPIVRGKEKAKTEFGSKLQVSLVSGFTFIDYLDWEAFNESGHLVDSVEQYKGRFGFYPAEVLADQIYCTRANRKEMKNRGIHLAAKPLGRPKAGAVQNHVRPGERNPIEGKFGQGKVKYGLENIRAKLATTSVSWVASIALVLNLINLMRQALMSLLITQVKRVIKKMKIFMLLSVQNYIDLNWEKSVLSSY